MAIRKPSEYFDREKASVENAIQGSIENPELNTFSDAYDAFKRNLSKVDVLTDFSETLGNYQSNIEKVNHLSEKIDEINGDIKNLLTKEDLDKALVSQLLFLEECIRDVQDKVKAINQKNLIQIRLDVSDLSETVNTFVDDELPKYEKLVVDSEIRLTNRCEVLEEELKETLDNIKDVVDEKYVEDFNSLNEELGKIKNNDIPKYKNLIVDSEIKTDSKIKEFAEFLDNTVNDVVSKIELVKEDNTEIFDTLNSKVSEVNQIHDLMIEDIEKSETTRDELDKKVVDLKIEILRNESHIENQNKSIETIHEDVKSAIDKLSIEEIQKNNSRLASKIKYIEEVFEKFNEKEILNESIITEPSSSDNSDSLTPLDQKFVTLDQLQSHYRLFVNRIQQQLSTLGGGGETKLKYLDDIVGIATNASVYNGKFLKYDHSIEKFEFVTVSGGGGSTGVTIENNGSSVGTEITTINFGTNVTATASGSIATITSSGGGGSQTLDQTLQLGDTSTRGMSVGVVTSTKLHIDPVGSGVTYSENLVVLGNGRVTGILSIGTSSIVLDPNNKKITGIEELELGTTTLKHDAAGNITFVNTTNPTEIINVGIGTTVSVNTSGIITALSFSGSGVNLTNIPNTSLDNNSVSFGGVSVDLGSSDATPAFDLSDATNYPTSSLSGTITNAQLAGSIANAKLANDSVSYGGVSLDLGTSDATPAFDLSDATNYPTSSLSGTITNAQLAGSIANAKLSNSSIAIGGVTLNLGDTDATPAFNLSDATAYPYTSLTGITTEIVGDTTPQLGGNLDVNGNDITGTGDINISGAITATSLSITDKLTSTGIGISVLNGASDTATIAGPSNLIIDPGVVGDNTGIVRIKGDLYVDGTETIVNSTTVEIADKVIGIATTCTSDLLTDGAGIGIGSDKTFLYEFNSGTNPSLKSSENLNVLTGKGYQVNQVEVLNATTLGSSVVNSSLTSVGTLSALTVGGDLSIADKIVHTGDTDTAIRFPAADTITAETGGTERLRITSAGKLGIGTDNPTNTLEISKVDNHGITLTRPAGGTNPGTVKFEVHSNGSGRLISERDFNLNFDTDNVGNQNFSVSANGAERLRIKSDGKVGIGTDNPSEKLDVNGTVKATTFSGSGANLTSIPNSALTNDSVSYGGVSLDLGQSDATPAFDLSDATNYPYTSLTGITTEIVGDTTPQLGGNLDLNSKFITGTGGINVTGVITATTFSGNLPTTDLTGTITNAQLAGSIANAKLVNDSVSYGGVSVDLGASDATPAFDLSDATNYPYTNLTGITTEIVGDTTPQLGGNLDLNSKFITGTGGINVTGVVTATTFSGNLPTTDLTGTITNAQLAGSIANAKLVNDSVSYGGVSLDLGTSDATPAFDLSDATNYPTSSLSGTITNAQLAGSIADGKLASTFLKNVVEDTTPQLGGNLDFNSKFITGTGGINVTGVVTATTFSGNLPTTDLTGTITNAQLAGSIANAKLSNSSIAIGGVTLNLGDTDATPAFNLSDATNYPTSSLSGTITNAQLAGSIANAKLANDSVSFGGVSLDLGTSDATPAFDLSDATNYPTSSLSGTITNAQLAGSIADGKLASTFLKNVVEDTTPQLGGNLDFNSKFITGTGGINVTGVVTATSFSGSGANLTNLTGASAATYGDGSNVAQIVVDANGRITGISNVSISGGGGGATDKIEEGNTSAEVIDTGSDGRFIVKTEGSERLRIDPIGNVGIGTDSTDSKLEVNVGAAVSAFDIQGSAGQLFSVTNNLTSGSIFSVNDVSGIPSIDVNADGTIQLAPFGVTEKVGIGTTNPTSKLHLIGNARVTGVITATTFSGNLPTTDLTGTITNAQLAGSIANAKLANDSVSYGGISLDLGQSDATPAFDLSDATNYPTSSLSGTITNAQLAGSIANSKLANDSVSYGGVSLDLGTSDATPAFDLSDATNYPTSSLSGTITNAQLAGSIADGKLASTFLKNVVEDTTPQLGGNLDFNNKFITGTGGINVTGVITATTFSGNLPTTDLTGTITNAQLAGSIANSKLANDSVSYGGVSVDLGASDATPAFDLSDATNYPTSSLSGTITNAQLAGSIADGKLASTFLKNIVEDTTPQLGGNLDFNSKFITGTGGINVTGVVTATTFSGSGASLTSLNASNLGSGTIPDDRFPATLPAISGANLTNLPSGSTIPVADESSDTTCFPVFTTAATGNQAPKTGSNFTFNSSTGTVKLTSSGSAITINNTITDIVDIGQDSGAFSINAGGTANKMIVKAAGTERFEVNTSGIEVTGVATATTFSGNLPTTDLTGTITNAQLAGSIANAKLVNDSVSFGGVSLDLGTSDATPAFDLSDATNYPTSSLSGTITNAQLAGSIADGKLASTFLKNVVEDTTPQLGGNLDFNSKFITGTGGINVTGVVTATTFSGSGASLTALTGASAATYGDGSNVAQIVVDANGRITGISNVSISGGATAIKCAIYKDTTGDEDVSSTSNVTITNIDAASSFNDAIFSESGGVYTVSEAGVYEIRFELGVYVDTGSNYRYTAEYACTKNGTSTVLALAQDGYIRRATGADETQLGLTTIEELAANDNIRFIIKRISTSTNGNAKLKQNCSRVMIKKLSDD